MDELHNAVPVLPGFETLVLALLDIESHLRRLADHVDPPPADIVGTAYVAELLDCTPDWIAKLAGSGEIPSKCLVEGTGKGKPWKFHRRHVEAWGASR